MADLSQYAKDMAYLEDKANKGVLTNQDNIYKNLKQKAQGLPALQRWFQSQIDSKVKWV